jgi:hypothetical protein
VVAVRQEAPLRPVVQVLCDERGRPPEEETLLDLKERPEIGILEPLSADYVSELLADPPAAH